MVSSQLPCVSRTGKHDAFQSWLLLAMQPTHAAHSEHVELDFSDIFGSSPVQTPTHVTAVDSANHAPLHDGHELIQDDPVIIFSRSHSLVGPSSIVSQSFYLEKLKIGETEATEGVESSDWETLRECQENCSEVEINEETMKNVSGNSLQNICVGIDDFEVLKVVGQGAFAKVYQVRRKGTPEIYAMKVMRKDKILEKNQAEYIKAERDILTRIEHPFIVRLRYSFQTKYRLYLVLDFVNGGHLFFQLYHHGLFKEDLARIYAAEIVSAVLHLHAQGIMHRDLKPENVLLDAEGHVVLTDFGLAKEFEGDARSNSICGTVEYMSPEIILGKGHDKSADWWSVGILLFEMLTGMPPFTGNQEKVQKRIVKDKVKLPSFLSSEAHSLLKGLLNKDASKRLGSGSEEGEEIKRHTWFNPINWNKLEAREIQPSFCPQVAGKLCVANFGKQWTDMPLVDSPIASPNGAADFFTGFSYGRPPHSFLRHLSL